MIFEIINTCFLLRIYLYEVPKFIQNNNTKGDTIELFNIIGSTSRKVVNMMYLIWLNMNCKLCTLYVIITIPNR